MLDGESDVRTPLLKQEGRTKKPVTVKPLPRVYEPPLMPMADYEAAQRAEQEAAAAAAGIGAVGAGAAGAGLLGAKAGSLLSAGLALVGMIPVIGGVLKGAMTAGLTALGMLPRTGAASIGAVIGMRAGAPSARGSGGGVWSDLAALLIALKQGQPLDIGDVVTLARKIQQHWSWSELLRQLMEEMNRRAATRALSSPEETTKPVSTPGVADTLLIDPARLDDEDMIYQAMKDHTEHLNGTYEIKSEIDLDIIELQMVSEGSKAYAKIRESLLKNSFRGDEAALEQWMKRFKDPGTRGKAILELKQGIGLTREPTSAQPERNRAAEVYLVMSDVLRKDPSSGEYEGLKKNAIRWYQQLYPNKSKSEAEQWFARLTQSGGSASEEQADEAWSEFWEQYNEQQAANDQFWFGMVALADAVMSIRDVKNASRYGTMGLTSGGGTPPRPNANGSNPSKNSGTNPPPAAPKAKPEEPSSGTGNGKKDGGNSGKGGEGSKGSGSGGTGNDAKIPRTGAEWNEYFRSKYGDKNVTWVTKNKFEYVNGFDDHMIIAQGLVRKGNKGVVGGHNLENFEKILTDQGWKLDDVIVSRTPHSTVPGVYEIEYRLPALDRELKVVPGQYKNIPQPKTVYDSNVISNEQMIVWGKEAMANGVINGRLVTGYSSNGLRFTGYLDDSGNITNFHPSFEGK